jgi:hypothetical protein
MYLRHAARGLSLSDGFALVCQRQPHRCSLLPQDYRPVMATGVLVPVGSGVSSAFDQLNLGGCSPQPLHSLEQHRSQGCLYLRSLATDELSRRDLHGLKSSVETSDPP